MVGFYFLFINLHQCRRKVRVAFALGAVDGDEEGDGGHGV